MILKEINDILKSLSKKESKNLSAFLKSSYFNSNKKLSLLNNILIKNTNKKNFTEEKIYSYFFLNHKFNKNSFANLISLYHKKLIEFLQIENFSNSYPFIYDFYFIDKLLSIDTGKLFSINMEKIRKKYFNDSKIDDDYFYNNYKLALLQTHYDLTHFVSPIKDFNNLILKTDYIFCFLIIRLLKESIFEKLYFNQTNNSYSLSNLIKDLNINSFVQLLKKVNYKYLPLINLYFILYNTLTNIKDNSDLIEIKKKISNISKIVSQKELSELYELLISTYLKKIVSGSKGLEKDLLEIYKNYISKKLYETNSNNYLGVRRIKNIIWIAIKSNELNWADKFIELYSSAFPPNAKNYLYNYFKALIFFYKNDYNKTNYYINKLSGENLSQYLDIDIYHLKIKLYYELKENRKLSDTLKDYLSFLDKGGLKLSSQFIKKSGKFSEVINDVIILRENFNKLSLVKIKRRLKTIHESNLLFKNWLLEKILELEKINS